MRGRPGSDPEGDGRVGFLRLLVGAAGGVVCAVALLTPGDLAAQPEIRARLEPGGVALGRTVDLIGEIEGGVGSLPDPRIPPLPGLSVVGRSRSSSVELGRGGVRRKLVVRYTLLPTRPGTVRIPPIRARSDEGTIASGPLRLVVIGTGDGEREERAGPPGVFAVTRLDRGRAWIGEQVTLTFAFYHDPDVHLARSPDYDPPETPGFWRVEIDDEPRVSTERIGGRRYNVQRFRYALFPLRPGELVVGPARVRIVEPDRVEWWRPGQARTLTTDSIRLVVDSLPPGAPEGFDGAVGRYDLAGGLRDTVTMEGTPFELEISIEGAGNPTAIAAPVLPAWPDIEVRAPKVESGTDWSDGAATASKTFRYLLVPRAPGRLRLGQARLPYFDPASEGYVVDTLRLGEIEVRPTALATERASPDDRSEGPTLWEARSPRVPDRDEDLAGRPWFWGALAAPWMAGLIVVGRRHRRRGDDDRSRREARDGLGEARRALAKGEPRAAALAQDAIDEALIAFWDVRVAGLGPEERRRRLDRAGVPTTVRAAAERARLDLAASAYGGGATHGTLEAIRVFEASLPDRPVGRRRVGAVGPIGLALATALPLVAGTASADDPVSAWREANRAYRAGDFRAATAGYRALLRDHADPRLEADLAAALWRSGERGEAVGRYRRAMDLDPRNEVVRRDLARLERELGDPPDATPAGADLLGRIRREEILLALLLVNAVTAGLATRHGLRRGRTTLLAGSIVVTAGVAAAAVLYGPVVGLGDRGVATAEVEIAARPDGPVIGRLPEGSVIEVLERRPGTWRIRVPGRPAGWVAAERIFRLDSPLRPGAGR